jgi:hypothetical protein
MEEAMTETSAPWTRTIARALKDQAFKSRLLADPVATLKEAGVAVPDGLAIKVVENTANEVHMVLPDYPAADPLSDTELERIATGSLQDRTINEAPPYGLVRHWLGKEAVERLLDYAQSNEHRFEDSTIRDGWGSRKVDQTHRISRMMKLPDAGELASELKAKVECLLPIMFETLGCDPFTPHKYEMELVAHGNGAFSRNILIRCQVRIVSIATALSALCTISMPHQRHLLAERFAFIRWVRAVNKASSSTFHQKMICLCTSHPGSLMKCYA